MGKDPGHNISQLTSKGCIAKVATDHNNVDPLARLRHVEHHRTQFHKGKVKRCGGKACQLALVEFMYLQNVCQGDQQQVNDLQKLTE